MDQLPHTTHSTSRPIAACQICHGTHLASILFLGYMPPVNTMPGIGAPATETLHYPLELLRCTDCGLVQIGIEIAQEVLFPYSYPYLSGTTRVLRDNFADLYAEARTLMPLAPDDLVVDIGSNDGTLLANFKAGGHTVLGVEPTQAALLARQRGIDTLGAFFNADIAASIRQRYGQPRLITATNVLAHVPDPHALVEDIGDLLAPDGVLICESHDLRTLIETLQYDSIYHDHMRYYHLGALRRLFASHAMEIFHVREIPTHGGSLRVYAAKQGLRPIDASVPAQLAAEDRAGLNDGSGLIGFRARVVASKRALHALIATLRQNGERIYGISAPSRAGTLINYVGLDDGMLDCVLEISGSHKLGKYIPGTRIPVLDEAKLLTDQPEYALLLSWHIAEELVSTLRRQGYRGRFITPLPSPRVMDERA